MWAHLLSSPAHQKPQNPNPTSRTNDSPQCYDQPASPVNYVTNHSMEPTVLGLHVQPSHSIVSCYTCTLCALIFESRILLALHERHHHEHTTSSELHCNKCDRTFRDMVLLNVHMKEYHMDDPFQEDDPNSEEDIGHHPYPHTQEPPRTCTCDLCGKQSETNDGLFKHIETFHGETIYSVNDLNIIPQYDGIDDDGITGLTEREIYLQDPALLHTAYTVEEISSDGSGSMQQQTSSFALNHNGHSDMQYKYRLNHC